MIDNLDKYWGSKEYSRDVNKVAATHSKADWGGLTKNGSTKHTTISGEVVSIPVNAK